MSEAYRRCIETAEGHYENFPVLSRTLPRRLRPHVAAVYAFARAADDAADEVQGPRGAAMLEDMRRRLEDRRYEGDPVFEALGATMREFDLPDKPFLDLLSAFLQDTQKTRYETFEEVLDYCSRSANPVGRIVLMLMGFRDAQRFELSDRICTALQLINFWQDIVSDYSVRGRIYIPREDLQRFGVAEEDISAPRRNAAGRNLMAFEIGRTESILASGVGLVRLLPLRLRFPVGLFAAGGWTILKRLATPGGNGARPTLDDWQSRVRLPVEFLRVMIHDDR